MYGASCHHFISRGFLKRSRILSAVRRSYVSIPQDRIIYPDGVNCWIKEWFLSVNHYTAFLLPPNSQLDPTMSSNAEVFKPFDANDPQIYITFTFMHLADNFNPKRLTIAFRLYIFISACVPWESNPQPFAQLMQCSTTEPHKNKYDAHIARNVLSQIIKKGYTYFDSPLRHSSNYK